MLDLVNRTKYAVSGAPTLDFALKGKGVRFPSTNDIISDTTIRPVATDVPVSLFCIVRTEGATATRKRAVRAFGASGTTAYLEFADGATNTIQAGTQQSAGSFVIADSGLGYTALTDYALGMTWRPDDPPRVYVNGNFIAASGTTPTTIVDITGLTIGNNTSGSGFQVQGTVYVAYHWRRFLSAQEMFLLAQNPYGMLKTPKRRRVVVLGTPSTAGPLNPGTMANAAAAGGSDWTNPNNAKTTNSSYATWQSPDGSADTSNYLDATNFGFSIPASAVSIDGITVAVVRKADSAFDIVDNKLQLIKGGTAQGTDKKSASTWPTSDATATYGGAADLWALTFTYSDINASDFGVRLQVITGMASNVTTASVDSFAITINYTAASGAATQVTRSIHNFRQRRIFF